jgi:hypothetical protein
VTVERAFRPPSDEADFVGTRIAAKERTERKINRSSEGHKEAFSVWELSDLCGLAVNDFIFIFGPSREVPDV